MNLEGALWLLPSIGLPPLLAALALLPAVRTRALWLPPFAALPALVAALAAPAGVAFEAPDVLLGARLSLDGHARPFVGFAAFLWTAAAVYARVQMRGDPRPARFAAFWCLTLCGNLGVFLADDVATFYAAFACVSLAAYPLVVHSGKPEAMRAGLVTIVLALVGETCLLMGFMRAASGADSLLIADVRAAIATTPGQGVTLALLVAGFGIKAGLAPLHVWLPLAHPAAPTPASAVLSGAIVKAGIFGLLQFLPFGAALPGWQEALLAGGLFTAFFGIAIGLTQRDPKTVLAYSTVSQMGLVTAVLAMALQEGEPRIALAAAGLYALHHGLAKAALFMGVGVAAAGGAKPGAAVLALLALPGLSLAGLPMTGGALAKLAAKTPFGGGIAELLFTLSAVGTALLMLRFLLLLAASGDGEARARPEPGLLLPWLATVAACLVVPWLLFTGVAGQPVSYPLQAGQLWVAFWPLLFAAAVAMPAVSGRVRALQVPAGDLLAPLSVLGRRASAIAAPRPIRLAQRRPPQARHGLARAARRWSALVEAALSRWSLAGALLLALALLAAL